MSTITPITDKKYIRVLFPYAYNILGSAEDAKDVIQDVLVKYLTKDREVIADEKNYLVRSVINAAINLKSRQKIMLRSQEVWLPEPVATDDAADRNLYLNDILSYSLLVLMERLTAKERAVFILKETFDYSHSEIADLLSITEENVRKLLSRAKVALFKPAQQRSRQQAAHEREVLAGLLAAIRQRDTQAVERAMAADIRFYADGGGKVPLLAVESRGAGPVAALLLKAYHRFLAFARMEYALVNHQPALLTHIDGRLTACQVFDVHSLTGTILRIDAVLDPDKLKSLSQRP